MALIAVLNILHDTDKGCHSANRGDRLEMLIWVIVEGNNKWAIVTFSLEDFKQLAPRSAEIYLISSYVQSSIVLLTVQ